MSHPSDDSAGRPRAEREHASETAAEALGGTISDPAGDGLARSQGFKCSPEPTVGVEIEAAVLDPASGRLAPGSPRILDACREEGIDGVTAELMRSMLEVRSGSAVAGCADIAEVADQLFERLGRVRNVAHSLGYEIALMGTHPSSLPNENVLFPNERYEQASERFAWMIYHRVTFGQHVHIGVRSGDEALAGLLVYSQPHPACASLGR